MQLGHRLLIAAGWLGLGVAGQIGLQVHLNRAESTGGYPELRRELEAFPALLSARGGGTGSTRQGIAWRGVDRSDLERLRSRLAFDHQGLVARLYESDGGRPVSLYMVYSRSGEDRKHHPEICIREVLGAPEDLEARQRLYLDAAGERPVQRFRFRTGTNQHTTMYYWHYTLDAEPDPRQSFVQVLHRKLSQPAPSITVQVAAAGSTAELEGVESAFLPAVDAALRQAHLPPTARIACDRLPIGLIRD